MSKHIWLKNIYSSIIHKHYPTTNLNRDEAHKSSQRSGTFPHVAYSSEPFYLILNTRNSQAFMSHEVEKLKASVTKV